MLFQTIGNNATTLPKTNSIQHNNVVNQCRWAMYSAHIRSVILSLNWVMSLFAASDISTTCLWVAVLLDALVLQLDWLQVEVPTTPEGAQVWNSSSPRLLMRMKL